MNNQEFLDILQKFVIKYDKQNTSYPESEYEGLSFYSFVCSQLEVEDNSLSIRNDYPWVYNHNQIRKLWS
jgi:hypothetical protein